jgi:vacuolar-type H+-ATPase subunit I/STV1
MHREGTRKPFIGLLVTGILAVLNFHIGDDPLHDQFSAGIIFVSFGLAALVILIFTEQWTWRAVGVMISLAGTSTVYGLILARTRGWVESDQLVTRSILRASLDVGGVLLFLGLTMWAYERRGGSNKPLLDIIDPRAFYRNRAEPGD